MIEIGDLVAVEGAFGSFLAIVQAKEDDNAVWGWTVVQCDTGDYYPCEEKEMIVLSTPRQVDAWERKRKIKKILDKQK